MAVGQRQQSWLTHRIGGKPPPTFGPGSIKNTGRLQGRRAFALDLRRPVKPRWPNAGLNSWVTRQDAGLAALGHGWPIAAAHGFKPAFGHTEPKRGAEWWGKSVLLTFALFKSEPL
ncbi:hypothetical protein BOP93_16060 [Pseudomonas orientalis]|uniref:Uncharacterized protein n=1 Tax=Pseudomonas orientalis TaxID=76758 RepID=A0A2L0RY73_9PSED|nr:hypothetical protein BOP93_16060 [Pseudomonas orientalis]